MRFRYIVMESWILLGLWYATNIAPDRYHVLERLKFCSQSTSIPSTQLARRGDFPPTTVVLDEVQVLVFALLQRQK